MVNAVALCCRKPEEERHRLCFEVFDRDCDGLLNHEEFSRAVEQLLRIREENSPPQAVGPSGGQEEEVRGREEETVKAATQVTSPEAIVEEALSQYGKSRVRLMTMLHD